jgi:hypothetical protein
MSTTSPHKAVVLIKIEVHDILPTGECSGNPVSSEILKEYNLLPNMLLSVDGIDMDDCLRNLKNKIEVWRGKTE